MTTTLPSNLPSSYGWVKEDIEDIVPTTGHLTARGNCLAVYFENTQQILTFGAQLIYNAAGDTQVRTLMTLLKSAKIQEGDRGYILFFPGILLTDF